MKAGHLKLHHGSSILGYTLALALPVMVAVFRQKSGLPEPLFPFLFSYPVFWVVAFFWGPAPAAAAIGATAVTIPLLLPAARPNALNWAALAILGSACVVLGSVMRKVRDSAAEAARAVVRFRLVTENISDWVFFLNATGRIDYANRTACTELEKSPDELAGTPLVDLVPEDKRAAFSDLIRSALVAKMPPRELAIRRNTGEVIPVEVTSTAVTTEDDTVIHVACRDLRERREAERKLRDARQWEALGTLAGGLAHDFNNLLTAMMGNASLAREMLPPDHEAAGLLDMILHAGARSATLIDKMLAASGYRRNYRLPVEPAAVLASALAKVRVPQTVCILTSTGEGSFPGEFNSLERLIASLIENAVESYGPEGGKVRIEIGLACALDLEKGEFEEGECSGQCLRIAIEDHGCGMDAATLERAFDPFFSTKFTGRGLGLAAVRGLVRAYSGKIWIRSRPGEGTRIEVWLPE